MNEQKVCNLYKSGLSMKEAAAKAGMSLYKVEKILLANKVKIRPQGVVPRSDKKVDDEFEMKFIGLKVSPEAHEAIAKDPRGKSVAVREAIDMWRDKSRLSFTKDELEIILAGVEGWGDGRLWHLKKKIMGFLGRV